MTAGGIAVDKGAMGWECNGFLLKLLFARIAPVTNSLQLYNCAFRPFRG